MKKSTKRKIGTVLAAGFLGLVLVSWIKGRLTGEYIL